jgi:hypothetical protein
LVVVTTSDATSTRHAGSERAGIAAPGLPIGVGLLIGLVVVTFAGAFHRPTP